MSADRSGDMDVEKTMKNAKLAIIFNIILMFLVVGLYVALKIYVSVSISQNQSDTSISSVVNNLAGMIGLSIFIIFAFFGVIIPYIIFYVLTLIDASKESNRSHFIWLIVGIFIPIVSLIGLFMYRAKLKKDIVNPNLIEEV